MFTNDLENIIFNRHLECNADQLLILTGYIGPYPFSKLKELPIKCQVIYGMYGADSIGEKLHNSLINIELNMSNTELLYSQNPVHAKCYLWQKNGKIIDALVGSANFSRNGLATPNREILVEANPLVFDELKSYFNHILKNSIHCHSNQIKFKSPTNIVKNPIAAKQCKLSFLSSRNLEVPEKSGLNWGANSIQLGGTAHTCIGDAEIRITKEAIIAFPNLFPPKLAIPNANNTKKFKRQNDEIELIWDDGTIMKGLLEQNIFYEGSVYPKAICSSASKSELGLYLRKRIGVSDKHTITKRDLEKYGRTDVTISLQSEGVYYMDFSVEKIN